MEILLHYFVSKNFPDREEAGTPNILGAITLGSAIHVLDSIGMDKILAKDISPSRVFSSRSISVSIARLFSEN